MSKMKQSKWVNLLVLVLLVMAGSLSLAQMPQTFSADFRTPAAKGATMTGKRFSASQIRMDLTSVLEAGNSLFGGNINTPLVAL